jgi:hypothetical protein
MTTAARTAFGRSCKSPARKRTVSTVNPAVTSEAI